MQNGLLESFNGRMRDELLNEDLFLGLDHARSKIENSVDGFDTTRPARIERWASGRRRPMSPIFYRDMQ